MTKRIFWGVIVVLLCVMPVMAQKAPNQQADALRTAISGPECVRSCFLGIEPGITSVAEALVILDANHLTYEKVIIPNTDSYTYAVSLPENDVRFSFTTGRMLLEIAQPQEFDEELVTSLLFFTRPTDVSDVIESLGRDPDRINSYELVYVDEQVILFTHTNLEMTSTTVQYIRLYRKQDIDSTLIFGPDIRPCVEPAALCTIPAPASVLAFTRNGLPIADDRLDIDVPIPYAPHLEITAEIDPQRVGSVVFSDGTTLFIDDTYPYSWRVPDTGSYLLEARPYSEAGGQGTAGTPLTVAFTISAPDAGRGGATREKEASITDR